MKYRAEIDGLRAIAVTSVLLYHAQFIFFGKDWFEGGYIGVDIFFVISGYLITRIILDELFDTGSFSFLNFYERRARRILPMLFAVMLVSIPFAWQKLLPVAMIEFAQSVLSAIFFASNFFFYFATTEYGADSALLKPFLHTWSLGVEEQFYIVFPVLLIVLFRHLKQHLMLSLLLLFVASLVFAGVMDVRDTELNFYLPFSRFWELAAGSILALYEIRHGRIDAGRFSSPLALTGLGLILYAIFSFDGETPHPSYITLLPILGVCAIIAFASSRDIVGRVLSSRGFVGIGLISYSLYLWHYPLFAFARMQNDNPDNGDKLIWTVLTLLLSIASYHWIEQKFRKSASPRQLAWALGVSLLLITAFSASVIYNRGFASNFHPAAIELLSADKREQWDSFVWEKKRALSHDGFATGAESASKPNLLVVGDSNSGDLINALNASSLAGQLNLLNLTIYAGCGNLYLDLEEFAEHRSRKRAKRCRDSYLKGGAFEGLAEQADVVIFASNWNDWEMPFLEQSDRALQQRFGDKFLYFGVKQTEKLDPELQSNLQLEKLFSELPIVRQPREKQARINARMRDIVGDRLIDYYQLMCGSGTCPVSGPEGDIWQYDSFHLTPAGASALGEALANGDLLEKITVRPTSR